MEPSATFKINKERDVRTHAYLWHTAHHLLEIGQNQELGSAHLFRGSLVFTAFALEAYLNWLGMRLFGHWQYLERLRPKDKINLLADRLEVSIDYGVRPWQVLKQLFGFRNDIAHGKPEKLMSEEVDVLDRDLENSVNVFLRTEWEKFCTKENAERSRLDVKAIIETLHNAATLRTFGGPFFSGLQSHEVTPLRIQDDPNTKSKRGQIK